MNNRGLASFFDFSQIDISKLQEKTIETLYYFLKRQAEKGF